MHNLSLYDFELPSVEDFLAGDNRVLAFQVVDDEGAGVDISNASVEWRLFERAYQDEQADVVISGSDSSVELVTDNRVDTSIGEWEVRLDPAATNDLWGEYYHRPKVVQSDGSTASWRGIIELTA